MSSEWDDVDDWLISLQYPKPNFPTENDDYDHDACIRANKRIHDSDHNSCTQVDGEHISENNNLDKANEKIDDSAN